MEGLEGKMLDEYQKGQPTQDDWNMGQSEQGGSRWGRGLESPRRPKDLFLEQQKCPQRPQLKHGCFGEAGGKATWMVGGSPGLFSHQQFSLHEFATFVHFYQRVTYLSPSFCSKMTETAGFGFWIS